MTLPFALLSILLYSTHFLCLDDFPFKARLSVVAFEAEFSQDVFLPTHERVSSAIHWISTDPVEISCFALGCEGEELYFMCLILERDRFQLKKILQSLRVNSLILNLHNMIIIPSFFISILHEFRQVLSHE